MLHTKDQVYTIVDKPMMEFAWFSPKAMPYNDFSVFLNNPEKYNSGSKKNRKNKDNKNKRANKKSKEKKKD